MKRIRGAGCLVRVTGPTDRRGESVTTERETAPVDMYSLSKGRRPLGARENHA